MKILDRVDQVGRRMHLSRSTVGCYQRWIKEFLVYSRLGEKWREPRELGAVDVERYLTHLAVDRRVAASTQNQASNAIVFLYRQVLADELPEDHLGRFVAQRAKRPIHVPTVLFRAFQGVLGGGRWGLGRLEGPGWRLATT